MEREEKERESDESILLFNFRIQMMRRRLCWPMRMFSCWMRVKRFDSTCP